MVPKDATTAAEVMATGLRFASDALEYAALGDNDTQAIQLMSSAKMSLKGMVAKVKVRQMMRFNRNHPDMNFAIQKADIRVEGLCENAQDGGKSRYLGEEGKKCDKCMRTACVSCVLSVN